MATVLPSGETLTDEETEGVIRFLCEYVVDSMNPTGHQKAQRALLRRMFCDLGVSHEAVCDEIVPSTERQKAG